MRIKKPLLLLAAAGAAAMLAAPVAKADAVADFYKGKQLRILIGYGAGGGYDTVTHSGQSDHRAAEHAGRRVDEGREFSVQRGPQGRHHARGFRRLDRA